MTEHEHYRAAMARLEDAADAVDRAAGRLEDAQTLYGDRQAHRLRRQAVALRQWAHLELETKIRRDEIARPMPAGAQPALPVEEVTLR